MKRTISVLCLMGLVGFFQYCASSKKSSTPAVKHTINYVTNVQPTVMANCSPCHIPPKGNKLALNTYSGASAAIDEMIGRITLNPGDRGFMPFKHDKLSDSLINIFVQWKADGLLEK